MNARIDRLVKAIYAGKMDRNGALRFSAADTEELRRACTAVADARLQRTPGSPLDVLDREIDTSEALSSSDALHADKLPRLVAARAKVAELIGALDEMEASEIEYFLPQRLIDAHAAAKGA